MNWIVSDRAKVLVVEDQAFLLRIMQRVLRRLQLDITTATDGSEGLEKILETRFDLVISDVRMPTVDGVQMLKQAKERNAPMGSFIFLTGHADYRETELLQLGANAVYGKPLPREQLLQAVEHWVERGRYDSD